MMWQWKGPFLEQCHNFNVSKVVFNKFNILLCWCEILFLFCDCSTDLSSCLSFTTRCHMGMAFLLCTHTHTYSRAYSVFDEPTLQLCGVIEAWARSFLPARHNTILLEAKKCWSAFRLHFIISIFFIAGFFFFLFHSL